MILKKKLNRFLKKSNTNNISKNFEKINCIYPMTYDEALARQNSSKMGRDLTCMFPLGWADSYIYSMARPYATIYECNRAIAFLSHKLSLLNDFNSNGEHTNEEAFIRTMEITTKRFEDLKVHFYEVDEEIRLDQLIFKEINDLMLGQISIKDASLRTAQYLVQNQNSHLIFEDVLYRNYTYDITMKLYFGRLRMDYFVAEACAEAKDIILEEAIVEEGGGMQ